MKNDDFGTYNDEYGDDKTLSSKWGSKDDDITYDVNEYQDDDITHDNAYADKYWDDDRSIKC